MPRLLAPSAASATAATASPALGPRNKRPVSQSISSSATCESPTIAASLAASVLVMGSCAPTPNVDTSCGASGAGAPATTIIPATTSPTNVANDGPEDGEDETKETAHLSNKRYKKCTSYVWKYFTKQKEVVEVEGKQYEQLWGYCNFARCDKRYGDEGVCGTTAFKNHLKSKHSIVVGQQQLTADSKIVGSIVSDLEVDALTNVVAKLKIEENKKEGSEDCEEDNDEEAEDMESDPDIMNDADEL